jgi:gliding motility-associated-like protein
MNTHIYKYKLTFVLLFLLIAGLAKGQQPTIKSMTYRLFDEKYIFACRKATPIDLFKAAQLYVSPENGYWGDALGVPYDGKADAADTIKERKYTNGNIFTPPTSEADTGRYNFYFYFTSAKGYCGITNNTRFKLELYIGSYGCLETISGELDNTHYFCFNSSVDMSPRGKHEFIEPVTIENLLLTYSTDPTKWKKNRAMDGDWVDIDVYSDRERKNKIGTGNDTVHLDRAYDTTLYVIIHMGSEGDFSDSINITVHPKSELEIEYTPDILKEIRDFDIDEKITITVDTSEYSFKDYTFLLNNKNLNKYYFGGDITKNEITLSALVFTGSDVEDLIEILATDKNNCIATYGENVVVNVPLPSVFTPDGDGINDVFLGGEKFRNREFHIDVSNRWGNLLYSGESGWDGTYRGNKVPPGTYIYVLHLKMDDGSTRIEKGTITLIREGSR